MKRFLWLCLVFVLCLALPAAAEKSAARFSGMNGQVEVRPDAVPDAWKSAKLDMVLNVEDHVKTDEDSSAILSFADMSTFVLKSESEVVVLSPPNKDSKVQLVAGNIWVNVKKMMKDGSMEIDLNQAVAGIKGTNITCGSTPGEDRIQVLRGQAEILIKATAEKMTLQEGEELIIKTGGRTEKTAIDITAVQEMWRKELHEMGDSIQLNEVPDTLRNIQQSESENFKGLNDTFKRLVEAEKVEESVATEFKKDAERFVGVLMEDTLIVAALQMKVDVARAESKIASQRSLLSSYAKMVADTKAKIQGYQAEVTKMLKTTLKKSAVVDTSETEPLIAESSSIWSEIQSIMSEAQSGQLSQTQFKDMQDRCNQALKRLGDLSTSIAAILDKSPTNQVAINLQKQVSTYMTQVANLLKDLTVVEIPTSTLTQVQDTDDHLSSTMVILSQELNSYNATVKNADAAARLRSSLSILNNFSKVRRLYINSQRLYESTMKAASGKKYSTSEQQELQQLYTHISDTYQQLGIVADQLQSRLAELESQLTTHLK